MRNLNLDQLRTLATVSELGGFSAAARRLNLTQPAVSLHVRELEQRFGVRLVERMGKSIHMTDAGLALVEHAHLLLQAADDAAQSMRRFTDGWIGRVRIGTTLTALTYSLPPVLRELRTVYPQLELNVTNLPTDDTVDGVLDNSLDLGLVTLPIDNPLLRITPLRAETLVAIFPASAPSIPDAVTPSYAARQPLVLEHDRGKVNALVARWLADQPPMRETLRIGTIEAMKSLVAAGFGMSIVPDVAVAKPGRDIVVRPLRPAVPCTLALIEHRNKPNTPALDIVRAALLALREPRPANGKRK